MAVYFNEEDFKEVNRIFTTIEHILLDEEVVELPVMEIEQILETKVIDSKSCFRYI